MPIIERTKKTGWASCIDPLCPGYKQVPVTLIFEVCAFTYGEHTGYASDPHSVALRDTVENESESPPVFADPGDRDCPHCGKPRIASDQVRPEYPRQSGQDPLHLLNLTQANTIHDMRIAELERAKEMAELKALVAQQSAALAELTTGRRTRKQAEDDPPAGKENST